MKNKAPSLEAYETTFEKGLSRLPTEEIKKRRAALHHFLASGWPTRQQEMWKYTPTLLFQETAFTPDTTPSNWIEFSATPYVSRHAFSNEQVAPTNTFIALNQAFVQEVCHLHIPAQEKINQPIYLTLNTPQKNQARFLQIWITLEENSEADVVIAHNDNIPDVFFSNLFIKTHLKKNSRLRLTQTINHPKGLHFIRHEVTQEERSHFEDRTLSLQAKWFRYELEVSLNAHYANCELKGGYLPSGDMFSDYHVCVTHEAPHCNSHQFYRGIIAQKAHAVFNGKVIVAPQAQKTNAQQKNDNILMGAHAEIDTKPELEIYANDVLCSHGTTVGELSDEALFYLASRGIAKTEATKILLRAFIEAVLGESAHIDTRLEELL